MPDAVATPRGRNSPALRRSRRRTRALRRVRESEVTWLVGLLVLALVLGGLAVLFTQQVSLSWFVVPTLVGGLVLSVPRLLLLLVAVVVIMVGTAGLAGFTVLRVGVVCLVGVVALAMLWNARSRSQLGVVGSRGESMLIELRDRLQNQGVLPDLPREWYVEAAMRAAGGTPFAGDFIVAAKTQSNAVFEVAVVDVSGKGLHAGTRALVLSGAFGGLLGALPPDEFLPAANSYLLRQEWGEGFATAIHLALDLRSGSLVLRSAGHPPAVQLHAGSGRWALHGSEGPVLGLMDIAEFTEASGQLLPGDAMLLYTDGVVETPQRDISLGIDKLVGEAERLVALGFDGAATRLLDQISSKDDDQALLVIHRRV